MSIITGQTNKPKPEKPYKQTTANIEILDMDSVRIIAKSSDRKTSWVMRKAVEEYIDFGIIDASNQEPPADPEQVTVTLQNKYMIKLKEHAVQHEEPYHKDGVGNISAVIRKAVKWYITKNRR